MGTHMIDGREVTKSEFDIFIKGEMSATPMRRWHRCRRWWRHGMECPFNSLVQHVPDRERRKPREDDELEEEEEEKEKIPVREPVRERERERFDRGIEEPIGIIPPGRDRPGGPRDRRERVDDAIAEAEEIIENAPRPIPKTLEPVGGVTDFLPPPPPARRQPARARTRGDAGRLVSEEHEVKGKRPTLAGALARVPMPRSVGLASAIAMNQLTRLHPDVPLAPNVMNALVRADGPPRPVFDPRIPPPPPNQLAKAAAAEEAVSAELANVPDAAGSFPTGRVVAGAIAAGAGAGAVALKMRGGRKGPPSPPRMLAGKPSPPRPLPRLLLGSVARFEALHAIGRGNSALAMVGGAIQKGKGQ